MFRGLCLFLCLIGIVSSGRVRIERRRVTRTTVPPEDYSTTEAELLDPHTGEDDLHTKPVFGDKVKTISSKEPIRITSQDSRSHIHSAPKDSRSHINPAPEKNKMKPIVVSDMDQDVTSVETNELDADYASTAHVSGDVVANVEQPIAHTAQAVVKPHAVQYVSIPIGYSPAAGYHTVQVDSNAVHETATAHPPPLAYVSSGLVNPFLRIQPQNPAVRYISAPVSQNVHSDQINQDYSIPVAATEGPIQDQHPITTYHPSYITPSPLGIHPLHHFQAIHRPLHVATNPVVHLSPSAHLSPTAATLTESPHLVYHVQNIQNPVANYFSHLRPVTAKPAVATKMVALEYHNPSHMASAQSHSVPNHERQEIQHVSLPVANYGIDETSSDAHLVHHSHHSSYPVVLKPIPVIYRAEDVGSLQYVQEPMLDHMGPFILRQETPYHSIPMPVVYKNDKELLFHHKTSIPLVHSKNKSYYSTKHVKASNENYSKQIQYSPASSVSKVSFKGSGYSYNW